MTDVTRSARLAYDDAATPQEMSADCRALGQNLGLQRAVDAAISAAPPSLHFEDYPAEVAKREIRISEATARLAGAMNLQVDGE
jgi:hypothetical protein